MRKRRHDFFVAAMLLLALNITSRDAHSQDSIPVALSPRVIGDSSSNPEIGKVLELWRNYLNSRPDSLYDNPYWSSEEQRTFKDYDVSRSILYGEGKFFLHLWKPLVLSIDSIPEGYLIQTAYIQTDTDFFYQSLWAVQHVLAKRESGHWRLFNALPYEVEKLCQKKQIGRFTFFYTRSHHFSEQLARKTVAFVDSLSKEFSLPQRNHYEYYIADNIDEITEVMGMPFCLSMSSGITMPEDGRIFTASGLEFYPHELTHLVMGACGSAFASEGIATWQGGKNFHDGTLANSVRSCLADIRKASEWPLDSVINTEYHFRSPDLFYATGGMVAALIYHAAGRQGIIELKAAKQNKLVETIEKLLGEPHLTIGTILNRYTLTYPTPNESTK